MAIDLLSDIRPEQYHWTICVRISRMWEFHGKSDDEEIKHLDLVIIDKKGNIGTSMYVEIPPDSIPVLKPQLEEGKVVTIKKFVVQQAKHEYRVVQNPYMIKLNKRTIITAVEPDPAMFPKITCMLTPFSELEQHKNMRDKFLAVSNTANFHIGAGTIQTRRTITLRDVSGMTVNLSLAGAREIEFDGDEVYAIGQETPVVAIFVGTPMKGSRGQPSYLSGTSAYMDTRFQCTVTITKLSPNQGWYYLACKKCSKDTCPCTEVEDRYKLSFMAADETYELEFVEFDQKAQQLIGKPIQRLQSIYNKFDTPAEISNLISQRYTFIVKVSAKKSMISDEPSYDVIYIKEKFGRQTNIPVFRKTNSLTGTSSSQTVQRSLPSLIPMEPKKVQRKNQHQEININDPSKIQY
ncbi:hypothetical protein SETIT_1G177100v2 [Setaria italica]|uniref:Replication protein A 70 kDa DNA-binding subunit B/D first OB fold domain-containing protein n=1 Tax=Setaria italica TaxID=4555 RepID=K3YZS9_SETIT|nr:hypothetical protein SETIT_1G177100v2 [Setaria italica]